MDSVTVKEFILSCTIRESKSGIREIASRTLPGPCSSIKSANILLTAVKDTLASLASGQRSSRLPHQDIDIRSEYKSGISIPGKVEVYSLAPLRTLLKAISPCSLGWHCPCEVSELKSETPDSSCLRLLLRSSISFW